MVDAPQQTQGTPAGPGGGMPGGGPAAGATRGDMAQQGAAQGQPAQPDGMQVTVTTTTRSPMPQRDNPAQGQQQQPDQAAAQKDKGLLSTLKDVVKSALGIDNSKAAENGKAPEQHGRPPMGQGTPQLQTTVSITTLSPDLLQAARSAGQGASSAAVGAGNTRGGQTRGGSAPAQPEHAGRGGQGR